MISPLEIFRFLFLTKACSPFPSALSLDILFKNNDQLFHILFHRPLLQYTKYLLDLVWTPDFILVINFITQAS